VEREVLPGKVTAVERVGSTVFRTLRPRAPTVHRVLQYLEAAGFEGAPRLIRVDGDREVLTFIAGTVPTYAETGRVTLAGLASMGELLRSLDDALDGFAVPRGDPDKRWRHADASSGNCVFRGDEAIAFHRL
jgi:hypothetical protein